jgi:DNA-binding beta-propeller fold protein YncE
MRTSNVFKVYLVPGALLIVFNVSCDAQIIGGDAVALSRPTLNYKASTSTGMVSGLLTVTPSLLSANGSPITSCGIKSGSQNASSFPAGLSINPKTCVITGFPTATFYPTQFTLVATNSLGASADAKVTLAVDSPTFNRSVCISNSTGNTILQFTSTASGNSAPKNTSAIHTIVKGEVNPDNNEVYALDSGTNMVWTLSRTASGNAYPTRSLALAFDTSILSSMGDIIYDGVANQEIIFAPKPLDYNIDTPIATYNMTDTGNATPKRIFIANSGDADEVQAMAYDSVLDHLILANYSNGSVTYNRAASGVTAPSTFVYDEVGHADLFRGNQVAVDSVHGEFYVASGYSNTAIVEFNVTDSGRTTDDTGVVAPIRMINRGGASGITNLNQTLLGLTYDTGNNRVWAFDVSLNLLAFARNVTSGNIASTFSVTTPSSFIDSPYKLSFDATHNELWAAGSYSTDLSGNLLVYGGAANGATAPLRQLKFTNINQPFGMVADVANNQLLVANTGTNSILTYPLSTISTALPTLVLSGSNTTFNLPKGIALNKDGTQIWVANTGANSILVFNRTAVDNVAPIATVVGGATGLSSPTGIAYNSVTSQFWVANSAAGSINIYDTSASGNAAPVAIVSGSNTLLNTPQGIAVDAVNKEVYVSDSTNNAVYVFSASATGNVAPLRTISGSSTGLSQPFGIAFDPKTQKIVVGSLGDNIVRIFNGGYIGGNILPSQTLSGAATTLSVPAGTALCD